MGGISEKGKGERRKEEEIPKPDTQIRDSGFTFNKPQTVNNKP
jgi:hypothetical protein